MANGRCRADRIRQRSSSDDASPDSSRALVSQWPDAWLLAGVRTPFIDYAQTFGLISPIDLGIKAAREVFARSGVRRRPTSAP